MGTLSRAFDELAAKLEQRDQLLRQFSADAAHELKTPLASTKALCDALLAGAAEEPQQARRFAELMAGELLRLETLIADLTELHRLESGPSLLAGPLDLVQVVRRSADQFRNRVPTALETKLPPAAPAWADGGRVQQVLDNLLENADRALGTNPAGRIQVGLNQPDAEHWTVWVEDNGPGIPAEAQSQIFQRFYRVDSDRSRKDGGNGLGLAICSRIMASHGGQISVASRPGQTRFSCVFPCQGKIKPP